MVWVTIPGAESKQRYYQASHAQEIRSVDKKTGKKFVLSHGIANGYLTVAVKYPSRFVHVLVAIAFVEKPTEYNETYTVDHINKNKTNNSIHNLRWASKKEQSFNRRRNDRMQRVVMPVVSTNIKTGEVLNFKSVTEAENKTGSFATNISKCINKKIHSSCGFKWSAPETLPDLHDEKWVIADAISRYNVYLSSYGRVGYEFACGYIKKISPYELVSPRSKHEQNTYSRLVIKGRQRLLHVVLWEMFNGQIPRGMKVNHIDHDKLNCKLSNLELLTNSDNIKAAHDNGSFIGKKTERKRVSIEGREYSSVYDANRITKIPATTITNRLKNSKFPEYCYLP